MSSSYSNPFSRPSPFAFSSKNKESLSNSPYSYQNNRIIESQVKPGLSGMTSHFINPSSTTAYTSNYMDRYNGNQRSNPFTNPTSRPSITESPLPSYDPMFSANNQFSNSSMYQNQSYNQGPKQNPFNRPSLFSNSHNNSNSLREDFSIRQTSSRKPTSEYKTDYPIPTNYDHLIYKPNSNYSENIRNPVTSYSNQVNQVNKYSPHKYNTNNYRTDNSDTASVTSYINKVNDLMQDVPYRKNREFGESGTDQIDMFEQKPIKDYSHLQYKPNKNQTMGNIVQSNGFDKSKYMYQKQKSKSNQYQLANNRNKYELNNQQQQQYKGNYGRNRRNGEANTFNYYNGKSSDQNIKGHMEYQRVESPKRNKNSIQKEKYEKKYQFQDFDQNQQYMEKKQSKNYERNDYKPVNRYEPVQKYEPNKKYQPLQNYDRNQNYEPILKNNNFENFDEDKQFNFDRRSSFNGDDLEEQPRFDNNFRNNLSQPENYGSPMKYTHPQFGMSHKPENGERQNGMIVRFGDDDSHYVNDYSLQNHRQVQSVPTNDSRLNRESGNERYPLVVNLKGVQFYKVSLVNN